MVLTRVGGLLLIAGIAAVAAWAITFAGPAAPAGPSGPGETRGDTTLVIAFALLLGAGAGTIGIAGPPRLDSRLTRVGLGITAVGMLSLALGRAVVVIPAGSNELSSLPYLFLVFGGGLATATGSLICGISLARSPSLGPRIVGFALVAGPLSLPLAAAISLPLHVDGSGVVLIGLSFVILGYAGIGILALGIGGPQRRHA